MRILISDDLSTEAKTILERVPGAKVDMKVGLKPDQLKAIIGEYEALAVRSATKVTAEILAAAPKLRVIGRAGTGVDNIDLEAATRRGIVVMNAPGGNTVSVAEHTLALLLALARQIPEASQSTRAGKWEKKKFSSGRELQGKTLGVVGTGNIGGVVVKRAISFGMNVIGYDPFLTQEAATKMSVELVSLDDIFLRSDAITLHVPLTEQTKNMVNRERIALMKPGALLVNCARGGLVDELALAEALKAGKLGGAALDVFEKEPPAADHPLFSCPNFIGTPHLGGSTEDAQASVAVIVAEAMVEYLMTGTIRNAVNVPSLTKELLDRLGPWLRLAEKLGSLAGQLVSLHGNGKSAPEAAEILYAGEVALQPSAALTAAALKGVLGHFLAEPVNEVSGPALARERGIRVTEIKTQESPDFASLLQLKLKGAGRELLVAGTIVGKREPRVVRMDAFEVEALPEGSVIVMQNDDVPGVIGSVGQALAAGQVNIAQFALARNRRSGEALALVNVDTPASHETLAALRKLPHVRAVHQVHL